MNHKTTGVLLKQGWKIAMLHPVWMCAAILLSTVSTIAYFVPYWAIYRIVCQTVTGWPPISAMDTAQILRLGLIGAAGAIVNVLCFFGGLICSHVAAFDTALDLRLTFADHISKLPLGFHIGMGSGKLRGTMDGHIGGLQSFLAHKLPDIVVGIVCPVMLVGITLLLDWRLGIAVLAGILAAYFFHSRSLGKGGVKNEMELYYDALAVMNEAAVEYVRGITVIKLFGNSGNTATNLHKAIHGYTAMTIPYTRTWEKYMCWYEVLINNIYLFLLPAGAAILLHTQDLRSFAPTFLFYLILSPSIASVIPQIAGIMDECMRVSGALERLDEVLSTPVLSDEKKDVPAESYELVFDNVSFQYETGDTVKAVTNVSFACKENTVTAIVGPSGSGKSTIAHLAARFWDVTEGRIAVGGEDIRNIDFSQLMNRLSFVFQDDFLFQQSIYDNIRMGSSVSKEAVIAAAKRAQIHERILDLPNGYDTRNGENGIHLSGGEKQRICIARAILKNAPILILDEATAAQDIENEYIIQQAIRELTKDKTVLMIAHRLSTIQNADQILVMKDGCIQEAGKHHELLERNGLYKQMWDAYEKSAFWVLNRRGGAAE